MITIGVGDGIRPPGIATDELTGGIDDEVATTGGSGGIVEVATTGGSGGLSVVTKLSDSDGVGVKIYVDVDTSSSSGGRLLVLCTINEEEGSKEVVAETMLDLYGVKVLG